LIRANINYTNNNNVFKVCSTVQQCRINPVPYVLANVVPIAVTAECYALMVKLSCVLIANINTTCKDIYPIPSSRQSSSKRNCYTRIV